MNDFLTSQMTEEINKDKMMDRILSSMSYNSSYDAEQLWVNYSRKHAYGAFNDFKKCLDELKYENVIEASLEEVVNELSKYQGDIRKYLSPEFKEVLRVSVKGRRIEEKGGWLKHQQEQEKSNSLDKQIKELTIRDLRGSIFQVKYWWLLLIVSSLVGAAITLLMQAFFVSQGVRIGN